MKIKHLTMALWNFVHFPVGKKSRGVTITGKQVMLDWNNIQGCHLVDCQLIFLGLGPVILADNQIDGCEFAFSGPAASAVQFLNALEHQAPEIVRATFPTALKGDQ
jgi:hypothetical protein